MKNVHPSELITIPLFSNSPALYQQNPQEVEQQLEEIGYL